LRIVRGRAEARWFPSRHNAALFRLFAYWRLRRAQPEPKNTVMVIDAHQSNGETWLVMSWITLTFACYLTAVCFDDWPIALALLVSIPLAVALIEVPSLITMLTVTPAWRAITRTQTSAITINSFLFLLMLTATSAYFAMQRTWVRFVAWQFLAMLAINAVAAVIVFLLRDSIARLEASIGGAPSAP
jgi:hypothetical protein